MPTPTTLDRRVCANCDCPVWRHICGTGFCKSEGCECLRAVPVAPPSNLLTFPVDDLCRVFARGLNRLLDRKAS